MQLPKAGWVSAWRRMLGLQHSVQGVCQGPGHWCQALYWPHRRNVQETLREPPYKLQTRKVHELHRIVKICLEHTLPVQGDASSVLQRSCALPLLSTTPCWTKELSWFPPAGTGESFCFPSSALTPKTRFLTFWCTSGECTNTSLSVLCQ